MWWKKKSLSLIGLSLLLAVLVWSQMGMYLAHLIFGVSIKVNFFKFCISLFKENSLYYFLIIILLNGLIVYTGMITIIKSVQQFILLRRFRKKIMGLRNRELTHMINQKFERHDRDIIIIDHGHSLAFTMGIKNPNIILSSGLISMLEDHELEAVVEHETFHKKNYDSLKIFILQLISQSLWFIPVTKWCYQNYKIISEVLADEYAIRKMGSELSLGSALLKLIKNYFNEKSAPILVHFSDESVNYRLQQLVEPNRDIPVKLEPKAILISVNVLFLFMVMVLLSIS